MTRKEFLETLGRMLNRELSEAEVAENIRYYDHYIEQEMRSGKTEAEVLAALGDPRLIAKTILQVDQQKEEAYGSGNAGDTVYTEHEDGSFREDGQSGQDGFGGGHQMHSVSGAKAWLVLILVVILIWIILSTVFKILWKLLPVIVAAGLVWWLYQKFTEK